MQPDRRPLDRADSSRSKVAPAKGGGLDRGFGHMLQQAAISPELVAELAADRESGRLSRLENTLLARWPVAHYASVLRDPAQALEDCRADYDVFLEGAQLVLDELGRFDIAALIELRFPVGGVQLGWNRFELSDLFLGQVWLAQDPMLEWLAVHAARLELLTARARPYALAHSALRLEQEDAQTRANAIAQGQLYPYLQRLFNAAFNLTGVTPLRDSQVPVSGVDPLLLAGGGLRLSNFNGSAKQALDLLDIDVRSTTVRQLRCAAALLYEKRLLGAQQYILLHHAQCFAQGAGSSELIDWIDVFEQALADLWMRGDLGDAVQAVVTFLHSAHKHSGHPS